MLFLYQPKFLEQLLEKKGKAVDPESVLLSLWKQFDVLVGQLKYVSFTLAVLVISLFE